MTSHSQLLGVCLSKDYILIPMVNIPIINLDLITVNLMSLQKKICLKNVVELGLILLLK